MSDKEGLKVITPKFRASFVKVFKPEAFKKGDEPKYSIKMMFPKGTDLKELKAAAKLAKHQKFGKEKIKKFESPFQDGDAVDADGDRVEREEYAGHWIVGARSKQKPKVVEINPRIEINDESEFYSGCWARASIQAFAYDYEGMNKGVSFALLNIQKLEDDEAFGGGHSDPMEDFDDEVSDNTPGDFEGDDDLDDF
jgi:hypothetical protein